MLKGADEQNGRRTNEPSESTVIADEIPAKLKSLFQRLESGSNSSLLTARNLEQRLVKMRAEITKVAKKEARPFCNCKQITVAYGYKPEEFEAEMKVVCPIHGRRNLGLIVPLLGLPYDDDDFRLLEMLDRYARSLLESGV
jgi:hypothetical protein